MAARDLKSLYKEVILRHDREPFHYQKMEAADFVIEAYNPLCGDQFQLFLFIENEAVKQAFFHGYGCAISKAATSVLVKKLTGMSLAKIRQLVATYQGVVRTGQATDDAELAAFAGAQQFPERMDCALLTWAALDDFLQQANS
ncbi:MAG TPA: SUF system NifU family Fe-S cluster assembly protein [Saprospiraceae bacterium]|nr:SUF system NifU family Fe-S cluster assembly protein [Saprospiraceae bacterium]HMP23631.1 SUF system NifU family Fe-S cluster assembly protein [Saprospiraceae bacterium]